MVFSRGTRGGYAGQVVVWQAARHDLPLFKAHLAMMQTKTSPLIRGYPGRYTLSDHRQQATCFGFTYMRYTGGILATDSNAIWAYLDATEGSGNTWSAAKRPGDDANQHNSRERDEQPRPVKSRHLVCKHFLFCGVQQ